jgi:hypothetical protein
MLPHVFYRQLAPASTVAVSLIEQSLEWQGSSTMPPDSG